MINCLCRELFIKIYTKEEITFSWNQCIFTSMLKKIIIF